MCLDGGAGVLVVATMGDRDGGGRGVSGGKLGVKLDCAVALVVGAVVGAVAVAVVAAAVVAVAVVCLYCYSNLVGWLGKVTVVVVNRGRRRVVVLCQ